jgi:DNA-directed RNA polymerase subunit RPC12/RpoP
MSGQPSRESIKKKISLLEFKLQHELLTTENERRIIDEIGNLREQLKVAHLNHEPYPPNKCYICGRTVNDLQEMSKSLGDIKLEVCQLEDINVNLCSICSKLFDLASAAAYNVIDDEDDDD